tara:strand:- start:1763 stop:2083 length:321 start_codon:yes stop_codon:yes gene_type:complete
VDLVYFILCAYGLTYILVYGSIFNTVRPSSGKLGELFHCPLCTGFWSGVFLWSINSFTELFSFEYNLINALLLGCLSAGTSYFLSSVLDDFGLKFVTKGGDESEKA